MNTKRQELAQQVAKLPLEKQRLFFYQIGEKMKAYYVVFSDNYEFGNVAILDEILKQLQENKPFQTAVLLEKLQEIAPDLEEFPSDLKASQALDTCAFFAEILEYLTDRNPERLLTILELALRPLETELEAQLEMNPNLSVAETDEILDQQPKMQAKINWMQTIILNL